MIKGKKILLILLVIFIIGVYLYIKNKNTENISNVSNTGNNIEVVNSESLPKFFMGEVVGVESDKVLIKEASGDKSISITKDTVLIQQVKENGLFKNIPATISDIKLKQRIVIFYQEKSPNNYTADKIQILNF
jgi:hypothetical protein